MIKHLPKLVIILLILISFAALSEFSYGQSIGEPARQAMDGAPAATMQESMAAAVADEPKTKWIHIYGRVDTVHCTTDFDGRVCCGVAGMWGCENGR